MVSTIIKTGASILAAAGVNKVVSNIINATTPEKMKRGEAILVGIGSGVIGMIAAEAGYTYIKELLDSTKVSVKEIEPEDEEEIIDISLEDKPLVEATD